MKVRENQPKEVSLKTPTSPTNLYIFDKFRYAQWYVTQRTLSMYRSGWVKAEKLPPYRPKGRCLIQFERPFHKTAIKSL